MGCRYRQDSSQYAVAQSGPTTRLGHVVLESPYQAVWAKAEFPIALRRLLVNTITRIFPACLGVVGLCLSATAGPSLAHSPIVKWKAQASALAGERLTDPGFERGTGWRSWENGYQREPAIVHSGRYAIVCRNRKVAAARGAVETIPLNQRVATPVIAGAWSRCAHISGSPDSGYSLYLDITYQDGTHLWGQTGDFSTGTHGWEYRQVVVRPAKPIKFIRVLVMLRRHSGTAWFDDVSLRQTALFDGVPVLNRRPHAPSKPLHPVILGGAGFHLIVNRGDGYPIGYIYRRRRVSIPAGAVGGFFVRDAAAQSDFYGFDAPFVPAPKGTENQDGLIAPLHLRLEAHYASFPDYVDISGRITDTSETARAVTVYYALPVAAKNLTWWRTLRESEPVRPPKSYIAAPVELGVGASGVISRVPFACLQSNRMGLALALPMNKPRTARIAYDAPSGQYYVAFDFGLVPGGPPATFQFVIYASDPAWGLRAVDRRYMRIFPDDFIKRVRHEGIWMPFIAIPSVQRPEDFDFKFHEIVGTAAVLNKDMAWDNAHDVYCFPYIEPVSWWLLMPKTVKRTYSACLKYLNQYADGKIGNAQSQRLARATRISGDFTANGRYFFRRLNLPGWGPHSALFINNLNPRLPNRPGELNRAHVAWSKRIIRRIYMRPHAPVPDGEYLDSMEMGAETKNFRQSQFRYETEPLTFATNSNRPCILQAVTNYEFLHWLAQSLHRRGKLVFTNGTPDNFYWLASQIDVLGWEIQWPRPRGHFCPASDATLLYRRMLAGPKPCLLLANGNYARFNHQRVQRYMERSLFYAMYPSMYSQGGVPQTSYWLSPHHWYNRDRALFVRYIPIIRALNRAGWRPVTKAWTGDAQVWVERYGPQPGIPAALTVFNNAAAARAVHLLIAPSLFRHGPPRVMVDRVADRRIRLVPDGRFLKARFRLGPRMVAALFADRR